MIRLLLVFAAMLAFACGGARSAKLDLATVNQAQFTAGEPKDVDPTLLKAQILLDRARFSPGLIDGRLSENFANAVSAFQQANGLPPDGKLTAETWSKLTATSADPVLVTYEVTRKDVRGPFTRRIPARMERMARLRRLAYRNAVEKLAERFHVSGKLLRMLNPGVGFRRPGKTLIVPDVGRGDPPAAVARIEVDKGARLVRVLDPSGKWLAVYPASIGSDENPAPSGMAEVKRVVATRPITTIRILPSRESRPSVPSPSLPGRTIPWDRSGSISPSKATASTECPNLARSARPSRMAASD